MVLRKLGGVMAQRIKARRATLSNVARPQQAQQPVRQGLPPGTLRQAVMRMTGRR